MASTTHTSLLIVCPHCGHALTGSSGTLACGTCHVAWPLPNTGVTMARSSELTSAHAA
jgi:uncharacterized Zn finger protein (UPF0148 family)